MKNSTGLGDWTIDSMEHMLHFKNNVCGENRQEDF